MTFLEMRDWFGFACTVTGIPLSIILYCLSRPRPRTIERGWSVKIGGWIEVSRQHRESDQS